jgi:hypothetical protein
MPVKSWACLNHLGIVRTHDAYYLESPEAREDFYGTATILESIWGVLELDNESSRTFCHRRYAGDPRRNHPDLRNPIYMPYAEIVIGKAISSKW